MKKDISKNKAKISIDEFFSKDIFSSDDVRKIKRLAMKYKVRLGKHRRLFCKKCLSQLKGNIKVTKTHKSVICQNCSHNNKFKI